MTRDDNLGLEGISELQRHLEEPNPRRMRIPGIVFELTPGRSVVASRFAIVPTYEGWLEGTPEYVNRKVIDRLAERTQDALWHRMEGAFCPPEIPNQFRTDALPPWLFMVALRAEEINSNEDFGYSMCLTCFFIDEVNRPLPELLQAGIRKFVWEDFARDVAD